MRTLESELEDQRLIAAAQHDPAQFTELYEQNFERIYAFFARRLSTREEAQDLTAETFHQALASIRKFTWQGAPFIAWLYGIAANVLSAHFGKLGKTLPIDDSDLSEVAGGIERSILLRKLLDTLLPDQRRVLQQRFLEQKSIREIAQEMQRSEGAIKQLQLRAIENLRDKLGRRQ